MSQAAALGRINDWCHAGVQERVFAALTAGRDNQYLVIDGMMHVDRSEIIFG